MAWNPGVSDIDPLDLVHNYVPPYSAEVKGTGFNQGGTFMGQAREDIGHRMACWSGLHLRCCTSLWFLGQKNWEKEFSPTRIKLQTQAEYSHHEQELFGFCISKMISSLMHPGGTEKQYIIPPSTTA